MRNLVRAILLGLLGATAIASAGDQAAAQAAPPAPVAAPAPASQQKDDIGDFVPSEKVSADEAVSFPVDI